MRQRHLGRCDGEHCALVSVLAFCGLRWGEAVALRVWDVEYLRRRLVVAENAVQLGVDQVVGQTKGKAVRSVPIPEFVLAEPSPLCADRRPGDPLFGVEGRYLPRLKSVRGWFAGAVTRAGVRG